MALLTLFFFFLWIPNLPAAEVETLPVTLFYDTGNANESVAILGPEILELGSRFERYEVIGFEPKAIVLEDEQTSEGMKIREKGQLGEVIQKDARHLFIVKQLRAIFRAQQAYFAKYGDHFAKDIATLIREELLPDGFEPDFLKHGYRFQVASTESEYGKDPDFLATAVPDESLQQELFFSVDGLGQVRYAETLAQIAWGPVWDYSPVEHTPNHFIGVDAPTDRKEVS